MNNSPISVVVYLTNHCYLNCNHCFFKQLEQLNKDTLDYDILINALKYFKDHNTFIIAYTGGDPLLHPRFLDILEKTKELGMLPLLGISGANVDDSIAKGIHSANVGCVQVGLNGHNESLNDQYRGKGSFREAIKSIQTLQNNNVNVNISFCLDKKNYRAIKDMLIFAKTIKAYKVKIEYWQNMNSKENSELELTKEDKEYIYSICEEYMKKYNLEDWIQCPKAKTNLVTIHSKSLVIMPNGDIKNHEFGEVIGNLYNKKIEEILEVKDNEQK